MPNTGDTVGGYRVGHRLGRGRDAEVWEAADVKTGQLVALKVLNHDAPPEAVERFHYERALLASLEVPNVVPVLGGGDAGPVFYVMPLARGGSLSNIITRAPVPVDIAMNLLEPIGTAMDRLHALGMVHGDIKPENIVMGVDTELQLIDFGVAQTNIRPVSRPLGFTKGYAPPEFYGPSPSITPASDVYQLALVLLACITGLRRTGPTRTLSRDLTVPEAAYPAIELGPGWHELERVLRTALATDPALRYSSGASLFADARRASRGVDAPIVAPAGQPPYSPTSADGTIVTYSRLSTTASSEPPDVTAGSWWGGSPTDAPSDNPSGTQMNDAT